MDSNDVNVMHNNRSRGVFAALCLIAAEGMELIFDYLMPIAAEISKGVLLSISGTKFLKSDGV